MLLIMALRRCIKEGYDESIATLLVVGAGQYSITLTNNVRLND